MNLLVTGGAGFIGSHFIRSVLPREGVTKLVNLDCLTYAGDLARLGGCEKDPRYVFEKVDLRDVGEVQRVVREHKISHVIHFAAETHVDRSIASAEVFFQTNVMGTLNLLEACRVVWGMPLSAERAASSTAVRFLHISTDEVYGSLAADEAPFTESSALQPNSPYAASKAAADHLVRSYFQTYGLPAIITRACNNYGPDQYPEKLIPLVILSLLKRQRIPVYGNGLQSREWLHVEDHCEILWQVLHQGAAGAVYNLGSGESMANLDLIKHLCQVMDELKPELGGDSSSLISFVEDRPGHDVRYSLTTDKVRLLTGWRTKRSLDVGLRELVAGTAALLA